MSSENILTLFLDNIMKVTFVSQHCIIVNAGASRVEPKFFSFGVKKIAV